VHIRFAVLLAVGGLLSAPFSVADSAEAFRSPDGKALTEEQQSALDRDEILVHLTAVSGTAVKKATAVAVVDASADQVFQVLTDYDSFTQFMPYCKKVQVQKADGEQSQVRFELDFPWPIGDRYYVLELTDRREQKGDSAVLASRWTYVPGSGNINDTYGSWEVWPYKGGKSFVRYSVFTDPGGRVPGWTANMATNVAVPSVIQGLRDRVRQVSKKESANPGATRGGEQSED
jgi:uncharacterized membrane protein